MVTIKTFDSTMQHEVERCYQTCLQALGWGYQPHGRHADMTNIENTYMKNGRFWCLLDDEKLIGMAAIHCIDEKKRVAELKRMFILPEYQGKGYGNMMLRHSLSYIKKQEYLFVRLDTTKDRLAAVHLYEKYRFRRIEQYNQNAFAELFYELNLTDYDLEE